MSVNGNEQPGAKKIEAKGVEVAKTPVLPKTRLVAELKAEAGAHTLDQKKEVKAMEEKRSKALQALKNFRSQTIEEKKISPSPGPLKFIDNDGYDILYKGLWKAREDGQSSLNRIDWDKINTIDDNLLRGLSHKEMLETEKNLSGSLVTLFGTQMQKDASFKTMSLGETVKGVNEETDEKKYNVGEKILVHFRGNEDAEMQIGAGDMLSSHVRGIKICGPDGCRTSNFRRGLKGGFYDDKGYMPVYSDYTIEILDVIDTVKLREYNVDLDKDGNNAAEIEKISRIWKVKPSDISPKFIESIEDKTRNNSTDDYARYEGKPEKSGRNIREILEKHPDWDGALNEALDKNGISREYKYIFCYIMKIESDFNPNSKPIDRKTGKLLSNSYGLAQGKDNTWEDEKKFMRKNGKWTDVPDVRNGDQSEIWQIRGLVTYIADIVGHNAHLQFSHNPEDIAKIWLAYHDGAGGFKKSLQTFFMERHGGRIQDITPEENMTYMHFPFQKNRGAKGTNDVLHYALNNAQTVAMRYKSELS